MSSRDLAEALEWVLGVISGPVVEPLPRVEPDTWHNMLCRFGDTDCCCPVCEWEKKYGPRVEEWNRAQSLRPRSRSPLPTLNHVLVQWAERTTYRSATGALLARARDEAPPTERVREPWAIRCADVALEVHRSVTWAYQPERSRCGLRTAQCINALVLSVRGEKEMDGVPDYVRIVRAGRRGTLVDLAARGVIREPKGQRDRTAVEDRRRELEGRAA